MESDERKKLDRALELAEENHRMLNELYRGERRRKIFQIIYWIVIIVAAVVAFYFIQPYLDSLSGFYDKAQGTLESAQNYAEQAEQVMPQEMREASQQ